MYCPKCKSEYREGFNRCSECQIDLVKALPKEPERKPQSIPKAAIEKDIKLKVAAKYLSRTEADLALGVLQSNGIEACLFHDDAGGVRPELNYLTGGIRLMVNEEDFEIAVQFLKSIGKK